MGDEDVGGFDVSVDHAALVNALEASEHAESQCGKFVLRKRLPLFRVKIGSYIAV
jgi:hypothetical protein